MAATAQAKINISSLIEGQNQPYAQGFINLMSGSGNVNARRPYFIPLPRQPEISDIVLGDGCIDQDDLPCKTELPATCEVTVRFNRWERQDSPVDYQYQLLVYRGKQDWPFDEIPLPLDNQDCPLAATAPSPTAAPTPIATSQNGELNLTLIQCAPGSNSELKVDLLVHFSYADDFNTPLNTSLAIMKAWPNGTECPRVSSRSSCLGVRLLDDSEQLAELDSSIERLCSITAPASGSIMLTGHKQSMGTLPSLPTLSLSSMLLPGLLAE